jgi:hypothetical protein
VQELVGKTGAGEGRTGLGQYQLKTVDSECWCLNNAIFYAFIMQLTVEELVFILKSYLKTMSYAHCKVSLKNVKF